jgi:hypothetical protein
VKKALDSVNNPEKPSQQTAPNITPVTKSDKKQLKLPIFIHNYPTRL